jgi:hypothetical protein
MPDFEMTTEEQWKVDAAVVVRMIAEDKTEFTADDVWDYLSKPENPKLLGGVLRAAEREGIIGNSGRYERSKRRNSSPIPVWLSNVRRTRATA